MRVRRASSGNYVIDNKYALSIGMRSGAFVVELVDATIRTEFASVDKHIKKMKHISKGLAIAGTAKEIESLRAEASNLEKDFKKKLEKEKAVEGSNILLHLIDRYDDWAKSEEIYYQELPSILKEQKEIKHKK